MSSEVIVDALPYIDQGYDEPGVREAALALVEEETRRYRPTKNYLDHLPSLNLSSFETDLMKTEFERLNSRQPMDTLSMKRYELPPPPPGKMTDLQAWTECVENSQAQLEHQRTRIMNLDLMLDYGGHESVGSLAGCNSITCRGELEAVQRCSPRHVKSSPGTASGC